MNWAAVEKVLEYKDKQWYHNLTGVARMIGYDRKQTAAFLRENSVPFYKVGKAKIYFLPEVLEAIDNTRWKA